MAKKTSEPKPARPPAVPVRMTVVSVKMTTEFRDWLERVAERDRSTVVQILEKGAVRYAQSIDMPELAPNRNARKAGK